MRTPEDHETDADDLLRIGTVASVDLAGARITVLLDDDSENGPVETGPVRWIAPRMGAARVWLPPSEGEQVVLFCPAGEVAGALALGGLVCEPNPAPASTDIALIDFADGAVLSYDPSAHALTFTLPGGGTLAIVAPGGVSIEGDVAITGNVDVTGTVTASDDVIGGGISLNSHTHGGVQSGGSNTAPPS
jgi:phage baseplate assembly protein V